MPNEEKEKSRFFKVSEKEEKTEKKEEEESSQEAKSKAEQKKNEKSDLEQRIYQTEGILKTLDRKLESGDIDEEKHAERTKKLRQELAGLYEKKLKRKIES